MLGLRFQKGDQVRRIVCGGAGLRTIPAGPLTPAPYSQWELHRVLHDSFNPTAAADDLPKTLEADWLLVGAYELPDGSCKTSAEVSADACKKPEVLAENRTRKRPNCPRGW